MCWKLCFYDSIVLLLKQETKQTWLWWVSVSSLKDFDLQKLMFSFLINQSIYAATIAVLSTLCKLSLIYIQLCRRHFLSQSFYFNVMARMLDCVATGLCIPLIAKLIKDEHGEIQWFYCVKALNTIVSCIIVREDMASVGSLLELCDWRHCAIV